MGAKPPWKDIPDTNLVPADAYEVTVRELAETMSKAGEDQKSKLMYVATLRITAPKAFTGLQLYDRFTIGTNDDPHAKDPETWKGSFAARRMKQFVKAIKIPLGDDMDDTMEAAEGQKCIAMVNLDPKRKDPKTGREYGESNSIAAYYELGTPNVVVGGMKAAGPAVPAKPATPKKAAKVEDEEEEETPPAKAAKTPLKPLAKVDYTTCPICGDDKVPRKDFIAHVNAHESAEGEEAQE
jgi:hypothetical protein